MPTNETEDLVRSIVEGLSARNINLDYAGAAAPVLQVVERVASGPSQSASDAGRLASEVEQLRNVVTQTVTATQPPGESDKGGSTAETVLKTIGMVTGMGPIAAGLMTLFGSRSSETSFPTMPFEAPSPMAVDAGLTADRQFTGSAMRLTVPRDPRRQTPPGRMRIAPFHPFKLTCRRWTAVRFSIIAMTSRAPYERQCCTRIL